MAGPQSAGPDPTRLRPRWTTVLDDADRARLRQHLPLGTTDAHVQALLGDDASLLALERVWADMRSGQFHPRVVRYKQALRALARLEHVHRARAAHNTLVDRLCEARDVWATLPPAASRKKQRKT